MSDPDTGLGLKTDQTLANGVRRRRLAKSTAVPPCQKGCNMTTPSPKDRFDRMSIFFHWATLCLIALAFAAIEARVLFEKGTALRSGVKEMHYVLGFAILLMTLARLAHRLGRNRHAPRVSPPLRVTQAVAARAMHWLLYAVLIALPVMGWLTVSALGDPIPLVLGLEVPALIAPDEALGEWLEDQHSLVGDALYLLVIGHAGSALAHHYLRRDTTLLRMLPRRTTPAPAAQPAE